jgi:steroid delta-isomerase
VADAELLRQTYDRYSEMVSKGDVDGIVALYAEDATIEDPIGSELRRGSAAIRAFYEASAGAITMKRSGPVRVAGHEAATPLVVLMGPEGPDRKALDVISTMTFDESGKITSMRAYWSFDGMRAATADD